VETFPDFYRRTFGDDPPRELVEVYSILCDALYWGTGPPEGAERGQRAKGQHHDYFFGNYKLLRAKREADRFLAATAKEVARWERSRAGEGRSQAQRAGRTDRAGAGAARRAARHDAKEA
jgi:hypothetical protein